MKKSTRRRPSPWIAVIVVGGAAWVNLPYLRSWAEKVGEVVLPRTTPSPPLSSPDDESPAAAPKLPGPKSTFAPVVLEEELRDPFLHSPRVAGKRPPVRPRMLPSVTLVISAGARGTACVDGKIVGVGDRVSIGTITGIVAEGVRVRTGAGEDVFVSLTAAKADTVNGYTEMSPEDRGTDRRR